MPDHSMFLARMLRLTPKPDDRPIPATTILLQTRQISAKILNSMWS